MFTRFLQYVRITSAPNSLLPSQVNPTLDVDPRVFGTQILKTNKHLFQNSSF